MSFKSVVALFIMANILVCSPLLAQDSPGEESEERAFRLLRDGAITTSEMEAEQEREAWVPAIEGGKMEIGFSLGMLDLKSTLLAHDQIIYKYSDEATFWGDYTITGGSAFNPILRLGYTVSPWLSLEGVGSFSFSEYSSSAENRVRRSNEVGSSPDFDEPELGEFDLEARSLLTASAGINAVVYFMNLDGDGEGRWHPYGSLGVSNIWYSMNSNLVDDAASSLDLNFGAGLRILADRNISVRIEAIYHINTLEWTPAEYFSEREEGTITVPLDEFPVIDDHIVQRNVESYESNTIGSLGISVGLQGSF